MGRPGLLRRLVEQFWKPLEPFWLCGSITMRIPGWPGAARNLRHDSPARLFDEATGPLGDS